MSDVLTVLLVEVPRRREPTDPSGDAASAGEAPERQVTASVRGRGGTVIGLDGVATGGVFHLASDAALAGLEVIERLPVDARIAVCTGELASVGPGVAGPAVDRARELLRLAAPGQILVGGTTAVMVSHMLPPGCELVDLGGVVTGDGRGERVHELRRALDTTMRPAVQATASNLGWAHRAAPGAVVGRGPVITALEEAWDRALAGRQRVVTVSGDPGVGKTTVAAELALRVHARGAVVLYGRWDEEALAPYQAVREALGSYAAACPRAVLRRDLTDHADEVVRLLPEIGAAVGGVRASLTDDPEAERHRLFDAIVGWLDAVASRHPVLCVLDDLQWADRSSLHLLRHLLGAPMEHPVLVVVTTRDGEAADPGPLHAFDPDEQRDDISRIGLVGLAPEDVEQLVEQALGRPVTGEEAELARWLTHETGGNPLFVREVLRGVSGDAVAAALREVRDRLPQRLHDVVHWRLARLAPHTVDTLGIASLLGEELSVDVLAAVAGLDRLTVNERLRDAVRAGVLRDAASADRVAFQHAVVRRALLEALTPERATELHRRIADVLAARVGDGASAAEVAHHRLHAADAATAESAVHWARAAADQARRETAYESAVWFLARALEIHDRYRDDREEACELRIELAEAHDRAGEFTARDQRHLEAAELARSLDRTDLLARAALGFGGRLPATPPPNPVARALLDDVLARLPSSDSRTRALALARLAHLLHLDAPHETRDRISAEAVAMARRLDAPVVLATTLVSRCLALDGPDDVDELLEVGAEVIRIGEQTGDPDLVLQGARTRIQPLVVVGAHEAAQALAERFRALADEVRHPDHLRLMTMWRIMWAALEGRFADAVRQADDLRDQLARSGHSQANAIHFAQTLPVLWMQGGLGRLVGRIGGDAGMPYDLNGWALDAWIRSACGDEEGARTLLTEHGPELLDVIDRNYLWVPTVVAATIAAAAVGHTGWAAAAHAHLAPYSGRNCTTGYAAYLAAVDHHLGTLDAVLGRLDDAVDRLEAALRRHRAIAARPFEALSARWLADVLAARDRPGDADRATELAATSDRIAAELGLEAVPATHPPLRADPRP